MVKNFTDDERYSRVNTEKLLDAADKLENTITAMSDVLASMRRTAEATMGTMSANVKSVETAWGGEAGEAWRNEFDTVEKNLQACLEKYYEFPGFMRKRAEQYIKAAAGAQITGNETGENVRRLLSNVLDSYNIPANGTATIGSIRKAAKQHTALISGIHFDLPEEGEEEEEEE